MTTTTPPRGRYTHAGTTQDHIEALIARGACYAGIARTAGLSSRCVWGIHRGERHIIYKATATAVLAVTPDQARPLRARDDRTPCLHLEDLAEMAQDGETRIGAVTRTGALNWETVRRHLARNGRLDLADQFRRNETARYAETHRNTR